MSTMKAIQAQARHPMVRGGGTGGRRPAYPLLPSAHWTPQPAPVSVHSAQAVYEWRAASIAARPKEARHNVAQYEAQ